MTLPVKSLVDDERWREDAACLNKPIEIFFPPHGSRNEAAKQLCRHCPVRNACLNWALTTGQDFGIWAGTTETMRRAIMRGRPRRRCPACGSPEIVNRGASQICTACALSWLLRPEQIRSPASGHIGSLRGQRV